MGRLLSAVRACGYLGIDAGFYKILIIIQFGFHKRMEATQ